MRFVLVGLAAVALGLSFQALTVRYNYGGDWSGLFRVGDRFPQPPDLPAPYRFRDSWGYDGQSYRLIAHDPFLRRGFDKYLDNPRHRYSRILMPLIAWALALGNEGWVEPAYVLTLAAFVFAGAYWCAVLAGRMGLSVWWGLLFVLTPATLVGIDRLTVDTALAAFCVAFVVLRPGSAGWMATLAGAALCRETGFLLIGAACLMFLRERSVRSAILTAFTALPALLWMAWIATQLPATQTAWTSLIPLEGYIMRLVHPFHYTLGPLLATLTQLFDYVALAGVAAALYCLWPLRAHVDLWICLIPVLFVNLPDVWSEVYAFGRTMTPLWLLIALRGVEARLWIALAPIAMMDVRIGWQLGAQGWGIVKGLVT